MGEPSTISGAISKGAPARMPPSQSALQQMIRFVRQYSPSYRDLYKHLPDDVWELTQLPVIDLASFWAANTNDTASNRVLTGPLLDGIVFRTSGSIAEPHPSFYSREEWHMRTRQTSESIIEAGIQPGDRVANVLFAGSLCLGFILGLMCWTDAKTPYVQIPIGCDYTDMEAMIRPMQLYGATVIIGLAETLVALADHLVGKNEQLPDVHLLLFGGAPVHHDQKPILASGFPNATLRPLGYGSIDAGMIGMSANDPELDVRIGKPVYVPPANAIIEIIQDSTSQPITMTGCTGQIYVTNLARRLMPLIRYPTGDIGQWIDPERKQFVLLGRAGLGTLINSEKYDFDKLLSLVRRTLGEANVQEFQVTVRRKCRKDELGFRIVSSKILDQTGAREALNAALRKDVPRYAKDLDTGLIHPLNVKWVDLKDLVVDDHTGKVVMIVDERLRPDSNIL